MTVKTFFLMLILGLNIFNSTRFFAQETDQKKLEEKRKALKNDINKINTYIESATKKATSLSNQVEDLNSKIKVRENLIQTIDKEVDHISNDIQKNEVILKHQQADLDKIKREYADMVYKSYKNRSADNQLLFILSSDGFYQGYLRYQYLKQYADYQKKQGQIIIQKTEKLKRMNDSLKVKKNIKVELIEDKETEQKQMETEKNKNLALVKKYKKQKKEYQSQIQKKQQEEKQLTNQIENLIKAEILKSINKKTTTTNKETTTTTTEETTTQKEVATTKKNEFTLAPEAKELAEQFANNKGKLPWPVEKGVVTVRFGKQSDPMDTKLMLESSGVRIATAENQKARAIFEGVVLAIQKNPQSGILSVLIQHGNYITVYANLKSVSVAKGSKVKTKQSIGTVSTDTSTGKTILKFQIWNNDQKMDPALWIDGM